MSIYSKYLDELHEGEKNSAVITPNFLIKIAQSSGSDTNSTGTTITSSKIPNFTDYCHLEEFRTKMGRGIQKAASEPVKPDGGLNAGTLDIVINASFLNADFNNVFHQNNCVDIVIVRIQTINAESPTVLETNTFTTSYTTNLIVHGDILAVSFRYSSFTRTTTSTNTEGGNEGNVSSSYNFTTTTKSST
ncbi:hypothetical protein [Alphaproteobacteria bacterium endosymbiont of Tiliacea citrago]|uniref:hypothetical protein n=1 Tax=Alphaproteobacteria bacterium endosymbiont of Tiliacea citrago TaxID=3077944 RepID=UPI00313EFAFD